MSTIFLDSGPLGLLMQRKGIASADFCRTWLNTHAHSGDAFFVPEIADYELRRELLRLNKVMALDRLDAFNAAVTGRFIPVTSVAMRQAAQFWADARKRGLPTADPKELDADVILAAQAATSGFPVADIIVATTNPVHISRFVRAEFWSNI